MPFRIVEMPSRIVKKTFGEAWCVALTPSIFHLLSPELFLAGVFHFSLATGTSLAVPQTDAVAATMEAQATHLAAERGGHVADDAPDDKVLDALAVGTTHGYNLLTEESAPFVVVGFVATLATTICFLPGQSLFFKR